jgi:RNA polymerase sigma factor (sigma-70 family)
MNSVVDERWLFDLRARFVSVARRRVEADAVEDVVQEAMRIVVERGVRGPGAEPVAGRPVLAWCFQVLRNAIGNHYQRQRARRARWAAPEEAQRIADAAGTPLDACVAEDAARHVRRALDSMRISDAECARRLVRIADGVPPGTLAREEGVEEAAFYRRLYRCREKLRARLATLGIHA